MGFEDFLREIPALPRGKKRPAHETYEQTMGGGGGGPGGGAIIPPPKIHFFNGLCKDKASSF